MSTERIRRAALSLGNREQWRGVPFEEPSASTCTLGSVRGTVIIGYGEPKRARCRKRRIQPRGYLRIDSGFPYSAAGVSLQTCRSGLYVADRTNNRIQLF